MFEAFSGEFDPSVQHRISSEQLFRTVESAKDFTAYLVPYDCLIFDKDGLVYIDPDQKLYGSDDDSYGVEDFFIEEFDPEEVIIFKTPDGFIVDASELFNEDLTYHEPHRIDEYDKKRLMKVVAYVETHEASDRLHESIYEHYGADLSNTTNELLAIIASLTPDDDSDDVIEEN